MAIEQLQLEPAEEGSDESDESESEDHEAADTGTGNVENVSEFALFMDKYEEIIQDRKQVRLEELAQELEVTGQRLAQIPCLGPIQKLRQAILSATADAEQKTKLEKDLTLKLKKLEEVKKEVNIKHDALINIAKRSCLSFDGEGNHCNYFYDLFTKEPTVAAKRWEKNGNECMKFFRGRSLKDQPLDQGPYFPRMHAIMEEVSHGVYDNRYPRDQRVESFLAQYILPTHMSAAVQKSFVEFFRALPSVVQDVFPQAATMKVFQNTSCYPFDDTISNREEHILHGLSRSITPFFSNMDAGLCAELVQRLASEGVEAILEENEVLQTTWTRIFPEAKYDFLRVKEGDYELEGNLLFGLHGAMLFLGKTIQGQHKVIHAQNKKAALEKEAAAKAKADDKQRLQARADAKIIQCLRCYAHGKAGVFLLKGNWFSA